MPGGETPKEEDKKAEAPAKEKKWKQRIIKIWQYNEMLEQMNSQKEMLEQQSVGPQNFLPLMKLGQGSFGQVYLVEKYLIKPDGSKQATGK